MTTEATLSAWEVDAIAKWRDLVKRAARGEEVSQAELSQAAALAGRSAKQFATDVETVRCRDAAAEQLRQAESMSDEIAQQRQDVDAEETAYKEWWEGQKEEAAQRATAIRDRKHEITTLASEQNRRRQNALDTLNATADGDLISQEREQIQRTRDAAEDIAVRVKGTRQQAQERKRYHAANNGERIREAKLEPDNFALSD